VSIISLAGVSKFVARSHDRGKRANDYLERQFIPDFNRRFTIKPAQPEGAFVKLAGIELELVLSSRHERVVRNKLAGIELELVLSSRHERVVRNDNTVTFKPGPETKAHTHASAWLTIVRTSVCRQP
jgi:hypothetical protein